MTFCNHATEFEKPCSKESHRKKPNKPYFVQVGSSKMGQWGKMGLLF